MRTAHLIGVFPKLSETFVLTQLTGLIDRGVEVDIFALSTGDLQQVHNDVERYELLRRMRHIPVPRNRVKRLAKIVAELTRPYAWHPASLDALNPGKYGKDALNLAKLYTTLSFLKSQDYDILHCHFGGIGLVGLDLLNQGFSKAKLITSMRGADMTKSLKANPGLYSELVRRGDLFLPVSEYFRDKLIGEGCPPEKVRVMHDGIDLEHFRFRPRSRALDEPTRLLFIGRLAQKKGIFVAVEAVAKVLATGRRLEFTIVGGGELQATLEALIREQGISKQVRLVGPQPRAKVAEYLQQAHVLIAPSITSPQGDQEGIPTTVKEGMAVGMPVLSTLHSGIPELVEDGVSGFLVPENDVDALSERLTYLIDHPETWEALGRAGRNKVESEFDIEELNDDLVESYEQLLVGDVRGDFVVS